MIPSTYSEVDTVSDEKYQPLARSTFRWHLIEENFHCQFHVIQDMSHYVFLARDFLKANDVLINFASGRLTFSNAKAIELSLEAGNPRPIVTKHSTNRDKNEKTASMLTNLCRNYGYFVQRCKRTSNFFLKFLIFFSCWCHLTANRDFSRISTL